jgi:hypothetical protein
MTIPEAARRRGDAGEQRVCEALARLVADWTVYRQPRIDMWTPDFVAIHPQHGVRVIEVKNWSADAYFLSAGELVTRAGGAQSNVRNPVEQVAAHRRAIYERYATPGDPADPNDVVRAVVLMLGTSTAHARQMLRPVAAGITVWGDELEAIEQILRHGTRAEPPTEAGLRRVHSQLATADVVAELRSEKPPVAPAKIAAYDGPARVRRVRGPAGSGKSVGVAERAVRYAAVGRRSLIVTFNVTLVAYLRTLVNERARGQADSSRVTVMNYHRFCSNVIERAGRPMVGLSKVTAAAAEAFPDCGIEPYDAVLVDEGQDFKPDWWAFLRDVVRRPGGEALLVADHTQDIYDHSAWIDNAMTGAGFSGPWAEIGGSFRMPADVSPLSRSFARQYLGVDMATDWSAPPGGEPTNRRWLNVRDDLGSRVGDRVVELLDTYPGLAERDLVFLCPTHDDGLRAVQRIEAAGVQVQHVFAEQDQERRRRKQRFQPNEPGVKGSTIESFKGWESPCVIVGIGERTSRAKLDAVARRAYVGMTRVKRPSSGTPILWVVNADRRLDGFRDEFEGNVGGPDGLSRVLAS